MSEWINVEDKLSKPLLEINLTKPIYVKCDNNKMYISSEPKEGFKLHPFFEMLRDDSKVSPCIRNKCLNPQSCCGCDEYYKWKKEKSNE